MNRVIWVWLRYLAAACVTAAWLYLPILFLEKAEGDLWHKGDPRWFWGIAGWFAVTLATGWTIVGCYAFEEHKTVRK